MLVLTRKLEEKIRIGDDITISILRVKGNTVRVGIDAPRAIRVVRGELPVHTAVEEPAGNSAARKSQASSNASSDDGTMPGETEFSDPATTAVREFLAKRARRQNRSPKSQRPIDQAAAATLTRSA